MYWVKNNNSQFLLLIPSTCKPANPPLPTGYNITCTNTGTTYTFTLTTASITKADEGQTWQSDISTNTGKVRSVEILTIRVRVSIVSVTLTSPIQNDITVVEGTQTTFICDTSESSPSSTITWYKDHTTATTTDDLEITTVVSTSEVTVNSVMITRGTLKYTPSNQDNGWSVFCTASNVEQPFTSRKCSLKIHYAPVVQLQPFQTAIKSHLFYSICNIIPGNPEETTYTWTRDKDDWGQNTRHMTLLLVNIGDIGTYTCSAENIVGSSSGSFAMDVLYGPSEPVIMCLHCTPIAPLDHEVRLVEGDNMHITCNNSTSKPGPPSYNWSGTLDSPSYSLELDHVSRTQTGNVICHVTNMMQGTTVTGHNNKTVILNVLYKPIVHAIADATKVNGTEVSVKCLLTPGNPEATTYRWTRSQDGWSQTTNTMTLTNIQMKDTGIYTCTVQNTMDPTGHGLVSGEDSKSFTLTVLNKRHDIMNNDEDQANGLPIGGIVGGCVGGVVIIMFVVVVVIANRRYRCTCTKRKSDKERDQSKNSNVKVKVDDSNQEPSHYYNVGTESISEAQHSTYESLEPTTEEPDNYSQLHNIELQDNPSVTTNQ